MPFLYSATYLIYFWVASDPGDRTLFFILALVAQNLVWLALFLRRHRYSTWALAASAVACIVLARSCPPLYENDFYRYFWDGHHVGAPYATAPAELPPGDLESVWSKISFPKYATIYPPLAQCLFALFAALSFGSLSLFLWSFTLVGGAFFFTGFVRLSGSAGMSLLLLQHPLLVKEWFQSCHLDVWLVGALVWGLASQSSVAKAIWFSLGANIKLITGVAILSLGRPKRKAFAAFVVAGVFPWLFFADGLTDFVRNVAAYAAVWEMNSGPFRWIREALSLLGLEAAVARAVSALSWLAVVAWLWLRGRADTLEKLFWTLFLMVLLSPVPNPWYFTWSLPLAILLPEPRRLPALCLFAFLPLSYAFYLPESFPVALEHLWDLEFLGMAAVWVASTNQLRKLTKNPKREIGGHDRNLSTV